MAFLFRRATREQLTSPGPNSEATSSSSILVKDEGRLAELGYTPQLRRDLSFWQNFGVSFSIIVSPLAMLLKPLRRLTIMLDFIERHYTHYHVRIFSQLTCRGY